MIDSGELGEIESIFQGELHPLFIKNVETILVHIWACVRSLIINRTLEKRHENVDEEGDHTVCDLSQTSPLALRSRTARSMNLDLVSV